MRDDGVRLGSGDQSGEAADGPPNGADGRRISRDMEGIFGALPAGKAAKRKIESDPIEPIVVPRPRRAHRPSISAPPLLALGALIGASAAWLTFASPHAASVPVRHAAVAQSMRSAEPPALAHATLQQVRQAQAAPLPVPVSIVPAFASQPRVTGPVEDAPLVQPKRAMLTRATYHPAARNQAPRRSRRIASADDPRAPCVRMQGLWRARCMRPQILEADRRLRDAYDDAVRAGVDRDMLVAYRNRWNRIRGDAVSDPTYVAATFQQMAQRLDAARAEAGRPEY